MSDARSEAYAEIKHALSAAIRESEESLDRLRGKINANVWSDIAHEQMGIEQALAIVERLEIGATK